MASDGLRGSSDRSVLVLTSLAAGPKHGYALVRDIEDFAGVSLGAGTLYGSLAKLEKAALIEALPQQDRRRPYRLTASGSAAPAQPLADSRRLASIGLARLAGAGG
jgi:DNA-binding PadR family transcriptional regulator